MKIIQTKLKDMPSSLLAELGSYRYSVFAREEGWAIPPRLNTPGQEYDRFDRSDVCWLIAWHAQHGICGCARLMKWQCPENSEFSEEIPQRRVEGVAWEMSRFSARLETDSDLALKILWHALQLAEQSGIGCLFSAATPMLAEMFSQNQIDFTSLSPEIIQSEDSPSAIKIPVNQPQLAVRFQGARRFRPEEVLPSLGVSISWGGKGH